MLNSRSRTICWKPLCDPPLDWSADRQYIEIEKSSSHGGLKPEMKAA